jgi:hypothetical protein
MVLQCLWRELSYLADEFAPDFIIIEHWVWIVRGSCRYLLKYQSISGDGHCDKGGYRMSWNVLARWCGECYWAIDLSKELKYVSVLWTAGRDWSFLDTKRRTEIRPPKIFDFSGGQWVEDVWVCGSGILNWSEGSCLRGWERFLKRPLRPVLMVLYYPPKKYPFWVTSEKWWKFPLLW